MFEITADHYAWLTSINMFESESESDIENENQNYSNTTNFIINSMGNINLNEKIQNEILSGVFFIKLFNKLNECLNTLYGNIYKMDERVSNIIEDNRAAIKIKNFDIILEIIKNYYGIVLDNDYKTLLVAGDNSTFIDLFEKLYKFYVEIEEKIKKEKGININTRKSENLEDERRIKNKSIIYNNLDKSESDFNNIPKLRFREDFVDIEKLENENGKEKPMTQTRSVLEFIIIAICKSFSMSPKQSAALLSDNKKYLTHIIIKGLSKKNYNPVKLFYQEVLSNLEHFIQLIEINSIAYPNQISKNIEMSLSTFKPGLLSKNLDVVYISGRVLTKLAYEFIDKNLISSAWDWFVMPGGGLEATILTLKRHDLAVEVVVSLLTNFGRYHLFELFSIYLKTFLQNESDYFNFLSDILEKLSNLKFFTDEFIKNKIKNYFLDLIYESSNSFNLNTKIQCINFTSELWINFSFYIEDEEENFKILNLFKKMTRDNNRLVKYAAITQLFRILIQFARERNQFAPTIYKTLTFNLIENHQDFYVKEFIINNFQNVFKILMSIPVGILVEPYIKQINVSLGVSYFFNLIDINFLITLIRHPRLNIKDAILILDVLGKIYFELETGIYFYCIIRSVFTMILSRYLMNEVGIEFCFKYVKILIETFCKLDKIISDKIYVNAIRYNMNPEDNRNLIYLMNDENDINENIYKSQAELNLRNLTKSASIEMILDILIINNSFVNNIIKSLLIIADLRHFKIYEFHNLGIGKALEFFGNSNEIVHYFNINNDELDIDREFEIIIEMIYDQSPNNVKKEQEELILPILDSNFNTNNNNNSHYKKYNHKLSLLSHKAEKEINIVKIKKDELKILKKRKEESDRKNYLEFIHNKKNNINNNKIISNSISLKNKKNSNNNFLDSNNKYIIDNNYELLDLSQEEDRDIILLKKLLKDYQRFFKFIYTKYCGSIYHPIHGKLFNSIKEITETIAPTEIVKMFKEHDICTNKNINSSQYSFISKNEILNLTGLMNTKVFKKKTSKSGINLEEFIELFIQISYYIFNRPPYVYSKFTTSEYCQELIKLFHKNIIKSNLNKNNLNEYKSPDELINNSEKEICNNLNRKLLKNNNVIIPNDYKKFLDTEINFSHFIPDCMRSVLPEANIICLEVLDQILYKSLKIHFLESFGFVREVYKVRPDNLYNKNIGKLYVDINHDEIKNLKLNKNKKFNNFYDKNHNLKEILKSVKKGSSGKNRKVNKIENIEYHENSENQENSGNSENEIISDSLPNINKILERKTSIFSKKSDNHQVVINQYKVNHMLDEEQKKIQDKDKEKKRRLRVQYIKQELEKLKSDKKEKDTKRSDIIREELKKKEDKIKLKMESEMKLRNKIKSELEKIKLMKIDEEKKKVEKDKKIRLEMAKKQLKLNEVFYNKQIKKLKEEFKKVTDERKLDDTKKKIEEQFNYKKMEEEKKRFNEFFIKEKKNIEKEKKMFLKIENLLNEKEVKQIMTNYSDHFKLLFEVYSTTRNNINSTTGIHFDEFQLFCVHFNISNLLIDNNEIQFIFKRISSKNEIPGFLNFDQFTISLIYICLFGLDHFKIFENLDENNIDNSNSILNNSNLNNSVINKSVSIYKRNLNKINETKIAAMDGDTIKLFVEFLGLQLPYNRREIENYINIQKNITVKEKTKIMKEKSNNLLNYGDISKIGTLGNQNKNESQMSYENSILNE